MKKGYKINDKSWNHFLNSAFDIKSTTSNFKFEFKDLTKKFGQPYMLFCKEMWLANCDVMTSEEFRKFNGNIPESFFNKVIK